MYLLYSYQWLSAIPFQELESKLKEVAANGATSTGNAAAHVTGSSEKSADTVGKRVATKFIAQVEIKEGQIKATNPAAAVEPAKKTSTAVMEQLDRKTAVMEQLDKKTAAVEAAAKKTTTVEAAKKTSIAENTVQKKDVRHFLKCTEVVVVIKAVNICSC